MRMQLLFLCLAIIVNTGIHEVSGAKILALLTLVTRSHHLWNTVLMKALVNRGHEITVLSPDTEEKPVANLTYLVQEGAYEFIAAQAGYENSPNSGVLARMKMLNEWVLILCEQQLSSQGTQTLLNYPDGKIFDLIIVESEYSQCFWPFQTKFGNPPVLSVSGAGIPRRANYISGTPKHPAYAPDYMVPYAGEMNFMERVQSFIAEIYGLWLWKHQYMATMQEMVGRHFKFPVPPLEDYERNISVLLTNTIFGYDPPRPVTPNLIPVGGMHLRPPVPLEKNLQKFLDEAKDGAIFFALGTNVQSARLAPHIVQAFMDAFSELPQRVVWKFEADKVQNKPANVMVGKWLPQSDILGHKNMRLFITHNGLFSTQEALYFGLPTLGMPFFMDQHKNMERCRKLGVGEYLPLQGVTKEIILTSIKQILTNPKYAENARRMSTVIRDQINNPLDRAIYWVEYVLRHNGAPHLKSAAVDMPLYQYLLLDVIAVLLVALVVSALVLRAVILYLWRQLSLLRPTVKKNKTQ